MRIIREIHAHLVQEDDALLALGALAWCLVVKHGEARHHHRGQRGRALRATVLQSGPQTRVVGLKLYNVLRSALARLAQLVHGFPTRSHLWTGRHTMIFITTSSDEGNTRC